MKTYSLNKQDKELINMAQKTKLKGHVNNKNISCDVGAALITKSGKMYSGINIESKTSAPTSICGEMGAIAQMVADGEKEINTIVALWVPQKKQKGKHLEIMPPCGSCRHIISQFGNPYVIISTTKKTKLKDLYPTK